MYIPYIQDFSFPSQFVLHLCITVCRYTYYAEMVIIKWVLKEILKIISVYHIRTYILHTVKSDIKFEKSAI